MSNKYSHFDQNGVMSSGWYLSDPGSGSAGKEGSAEKTDSVGKEVSAGEADFAGQEGSVGEADSAGETADWYYFSEIHDGWFGHLVTGWHYEEQDGKWYYLNPLKGKMETGWKKIREKWYYLNPAAAGITWTYSEDTGIIGSWNYTNKQERSLGSMYEGEETLDGYFVKEDGAWDGNAR
jgi:hypothetical protein